MPNTETSLLLKTPGDIWREREGIDELMKFVYNGVTSFMNNHDPRNLEIAYRNLREVLNKYGR